MRFGIYHLAAHANPQSHHVAPLVAERVGIDRELRAGREPVERAMPVPDEHGLRVAPVGREREPSPVPVEMERGAALLQGHPHGPSEGGGAGMKAIPSRVARTPR
jgi:hypothetical protein